MLNRWSTSITVYRIIVYRKMYIVCDFYITVHYKKNKVNLNVPTKENNRISLNTHAMFCKTLHD